ncbi:DUF551 domain-containing protein [Chromohalobacter canadensis]|uniref:DUF551 domain-containing protein n=1 Tax=Chromohalobacter canadensis TaxID=141389 RepID=UPI0024104F47|nr:DUF551 domain-containing protein [Chromohalobacter canadensis]
MDNGWISVEERLPEVSGIYPACSTLYTRKPPADWEDALCYFNDEAAEGFSKWQHSSGFYDNGITHWMPLPAPPRTAPQGVKEERWRSVIIGCVTYAEAKPFTTPA